MVLQVDEDKNLKNRIFLFLFKMKIIFYHPMIMDIDSNHLLLYLLYNKVDNDGLMYQVTLDKYIEDNINRDLNIEDNYSYTVDMSFF